MKLQAGRDTHIADMLLFAGRQLNEFHVRGHLVEFNRKARWCLLQTEGVLKHVVTAMKADFRSGNIRRAEERKTHDVVPVHMRHENIYRCRSAMLSGQQVRTERTRAAAHVADVILVTAEIKFHTHGV